MITATMCALDGWVHDLRTTANGYELTYTRGPFHRAFMIDLGASVDPTHWQERMTAMAAHLEDEARRAGVTGPSDEMAALRARLNAATTCLSQGLGIANEVPDDDPSAARWAAWRGQAQTLLNEVK